ncbi:hypothetical protein E3U23_11995 [Erythrobacter litoralis]|uniref:hypothetical protein n=1 Tax=Erythrobacter litoralis TaxID=39960 RepID=UPI002434920C|nr:hypothetical protein [Erythrobacter litoralis]MDG6079911.1 hypothetical protein [Erythrobacter litoralis]
MNDPEKMPPAGKGDWEGLRELDRALAEDRLTSYTWKKTWADPWGRLKLITIFVGLAAFVTFVVVQDVIL